MAIMHMSVNEPIKRTGKVMHNIRMKVDQPIMPTLIPFSMVLRLLTFKEWNTEHNAIAKVHISTSKTSGVIISAISIAIRYE